MKCYNIGSLTHRTMNKGVSCEKLLVNKIRAQYILI